jgi:hypothetical protein
MRVARHGGSHLATSFWGEASSWVRSPRQNRSEPTAKRARFAWYLLLATAFPWESNSSTVGLATSVSSALNFAKLLVLAIGLAAAYSARRRLPLTIPHRLFGLFATITAFGALLATDPSLDGALRSGRLLLMILATHWVGSRLGLVAVLRHMLTFVCILAASSLGAWLIGLKPLVDGRLYGYLPPLHPNVLAAATAFGLLSAVLLWSRRKLGTVLFTALTLLLLFTLLQTGSRTAAASAAVGLAVIGLHGLIQKRLRIVLFFGVSALVLVGATWIQFNTAFDPLVEVVTRGGEAPIDPTLSGRTFAWESVETVHVNALETVIGQGLQIKSVNRQLGGSVYVDQGIDSAWLSVYVSGGLAGVLLLASAIVAFFCLAAKRRSVELLALLTAAVASSWTESFLADLSFVLAVLLGVAAAVAGEQDEPAPESRLIVSSSPKPSAVSTLGQLRQL